MTARPEEKSIGLVADAIDAIDAAIRHAAVRDERVDLLLDPSCAWMLTMIGRQYREAGWHTSIIPITNEVRLILTNASRSFEVTVRVPWLRGTTSTTSEGLGILFTDRDIQAELRRRHGGR